LRKPAGNQYKAFVLSYNIYVVTEIRRFPMNKETERKYESTFIPCGDALEKMDLFADEEPETEKIKESDQ
jgi:hypothetical protein